MFLLDTDVISRTSPYSRHAADAQSWLVEHRERSYLSVITISELWRGVHLLNAKGHAEKASRLERWVAEFEDSMRSRMLPVDPAVARRTGMLLARAEAAGHQPSFADACLAATADVRGYEVVTFNARHFVAFGVPFRAPSMDSPSR